MIKKYLNLLPEIYLVLATVYYWVLTSEIFNPIALIVLMICLLLVIYRNAIIGITVASGIAVLNTYFVLALVSEVRGMNAIHKDYMDLILFGTLFIFLNYIISILLLIKYVRKSFRYQFN